MSNDLSIISLIANADFVVIIVMLILLLGSVFSWALMFEKLLTLRMQFNKIAEFEDILLSRSTLERLASSFTAQKNDIIVSIIFVGMQEFKKRNNNNTENEIEIDKIHKKVNQAMCLEQDRILNKLERNVDLLATIGSIAPFIGLLGTVWGIMHSFQAIGISNNTNLSVVAPSIAEALLATATGLFVSIPAIVFYNRIAVKIQSLSDKLTNAILKIENTLFDDV